MVKAYGPDRPVYADPVVAGVAYPDFINEPVFRASVSHGLVLATAAAPRRPSLLARVAARLRGRR